MTNEWEREYHERLGKHIANAVGEFIANGPGVKLHIPIQVEGEPDLIVIGEINRSGAVRSAWDKKGNRIFIHGHWDHKKQKIVWEKP